MQRSSSKRQIIIAICIIIIIVLPVAWLTTCSVNKGKESDSSSSQSIGAAVPPIDQSSSVAASNAVSTPEPESVSIPEESEESSSSSSSVKEPQPPPQLGETSVKVEGKYATVTFKPNVESTINAIVATSGQPLSTTEFYDYFNRGMKMDTAVAKKTTYTVTPDGKTETYELPDPTKTYYLLVNAVENDTDVWQPTITVILLREGKPASSSSSSKSAQN